MNTISMANRGIVAVVGSIGAGKSALIQKLQERFRWDVASFGGYIQFVAEQQGLDPRRDILQDLGRQLLETSGPKEFLLDTLTWHHTDSHVILLDGVRHQAVLDSLREICPRLFVIFLQASPSTRYARYISRRRDSDSINVDLEQFMEMSMEGVESEIPKLATLADTIVDAEQDIQNVFFQAVRQLHMAGIA